jgi:hypothetical protein
LNIDQVAVTPLLLLVVEGGGEELDNRVAAKRSLRFCSTGPSKTPLSPEKLLASYPMKITTTPEMTE